MTSGMPSPVTSPTATRTPPVKSGNGRNRNRSTPAAKSNTRTHPPPASSAMAAKAGGRELGAPNAAKSGAVGPVGAVPPGSGAVLDRNVRLLRSGTPGGPGGKKSIGGSGGGGSGRRGVRVSVSVSVAVLSVGFGSAPFRPSSETPAVLAIQTRPAGAGSFTVTAKVTDPDAPAATEPIPSTNTPGAVWTHPAVLAAASNVVPAGSSSVSATPVASWLPTLA